MNRITSGDVVEALQVCLADADDGYETGAEILRLAFPKLHAAMERSHEAGDSIDAEGALPEADVREALHAELERFIRSSWKRAQLGKKTDRISQLAREMDVPLQLARQYDQIARTQQGAEREEESLPDDKPAMKPPLFRVSNHHVDDCGPPPAVNGDERGKYFGYFANPHGEQAVFVYDHQTDEASVRMGDAGWGDAHRVVDGRVEGIILSESEATWVRACWLAATEGR